MISSTANFPQNMSYSQTLNGGGNWNVPGNFEAMTSMSNSQWNPECMPNQYPRGGLMNHGFTPNPWMQGPWMQTDCNALGMNPAPSNWFNAPVMSNHIATQSPIWGYSGQQTENPFTVSGFDTPGMTSSHGLSMMHPIGMANVKFIDNDTETIIEIYTPGLNLENSEVSTVANEIRVRFSGGNTSQASEMPFKLVLPMPAFGDGQQLQASAANDFLRIVVATRKEIASTIKKVKPTKIK